MTINHGVSISELSNTEYYGKSHIIWYSDASNNPDQSLEQEAKGIRRDQPTFLYRCGNEVQRLSMGTSGS